MARGMLWPPSQLPHKVPVWASQGMVLGCSPPETVPQVGRLRMNGGLLFAVILQGQPGPDGTPCSRWLFSFLSSLSLMGLGAPEGRDW